MKAMRHLARAVPLVIGSLSLALLGSPGAAADPLPGAIFTSIANGDSVNANIYVQKCDATGVWLNGGPSGTAHLPAGDYIFQVTDPSGATLLSSDTAAHRRVTVNADGRFVSADDHTTAAVGAGPRVTVELCPYENTPNQGGEYKVWLTRESDFLASCSLDTTTYEGCAGRFGFVPSLTKTDNFKVRNSPTPNPTGQLTACKYFDAAPPNGIFDVGEIRLDGWQMTISPVDGALEPAMQATGTDGCTTWTNLTPGTYTVTEGTPLENFWLHTTPASVVDSVAADTTTAVEFGNVCIGPGGGHTLGFWSNRNGQALFGSDDLAAMVALHLRTADGSNFDPGAYNQFRSWLLNATATNMAYMLSAQLAAMKLNVLNGFVSGDAMIYAPGASSASALGFVTINAIVAEADAELGLHGLVVAGSDYRAYQELLKNALDKANNNLNFVQSAPCPFSFATTP